MSTHPQTPDELIETVASVIFDQTSASFRLASKAAEKLAELGKIHNDPPLMPGQFVVERRKPINGERFFDCYGNIETAKHDFDGEWPVIIREAA